MYTIQNRLQPVCGKSMGSVRSLQWVPTGAPASWPVRLSAFGMMTRCCPHGAPVSRYSAPRHIAWARARPRGEQHKQCTSQATQHRQNGTSLLPLSD